MLSRQMDSDKDGDFVDHTHRRALLKALAVAPVILTVSSVGARAAYGSMTNGGMGPNCSRLPPQPKPPNPHCDPNNLTLADEV